MCFMDDVIGTRTLNYVAQEDRNVHILLRHSDAFVL